MTNTQRPLIVRTEHLDLLAEYWLADQSDLRVLQPGERKFEEIAGDIEGLVIRTYTQIDSTLLERLPSLKVIGRAGVGVDNIDLHACKNHGVRVVYTPDANTQAVVEYVTCLLADSIRPRMQLKNIVSKDEWNSLRQTICGERQMDELALGIIGFGRIGRRVAEVAHAIGFRVNYHDILDIPGDERRGAIPLGLEELLNESDVLTIHIDGRPSNHGFMNANRLAMMRDNVILLNTSRGFVIDELALAAWLIEHREARAILDVHQHEPFGSDDPLLSIENAMLMPHLASRTRTAMSNMSWVVRDVMRVLEGKEPQHDAVLDLAAQK